MDNGRVAAALAAVGVAVAAQAVVLGVVYAVSGAYLLLTAPVVGLALSVGVYVALKRRCTTGSSFAALCAIGGIVALAAVAVLGISFGGIPLLLSTLALAIAAAITPHDDGTACRRHALTG